MRSLYRNKSWLSTLCIWSEASQVTLEGWHMCHNGYNHQSWVSSSFSYTAYSCWILFNATALSTEVHGLWYCWWALNLLRWAAFYGFLGMLKSNKWQTGGAIRKAHMFLINQQIDACLEGSLTPARVACQELLFNIFFFFNTWSKKVHGSEQTVPAEQDRKLLWHAMYSEYFVQIFLPIYLLHVQVIGG